MALLNSLILTEGQAKVAQQKAVWTAERQSLVAHWEQQRSSLQIQAEQARLQDLQLLHLSHDSPYRTSGLPLFLSAQLLLWMAACVTDLSESIVGFWAPCVAWTYSYQAVRYYRYSSR